MTNTGNNHTDASLLAEERRLQQLLRELPDRLPPADLTDTVLCSLQPKRPSVRRRIQRWLLTPRWVSFRPAILLPATATAVLLILAGSWVLYEKFQLQEPTGNAKARVAIVFSLRQMQAESVSLIGSFNRWNPSGYRLHSNADKTLWSLEIELEPGRYEYAFLVDGKKILLDPEASFQRDDGFGSKNSILFVAEENGHTL
jgi:hypothetical protein